MITVKEAIEQLKKLPQDSQLTVPGRVMRKDDKWTAVWIGAEEIMVEDNKVRIW